MRGRHTANHLAHDHNLASSNPKLPVFAGMGDEHSMLANSDPLIGNIDVSFNTTVDE